jgi:hypothetical protein
MDPIYVVIFVVLTVTAIVLVAINSRGGQPSSTAIQGMLSSAAQAKQQGDHAQAEVLFQRAIEQLDSSRNTDESLLCSALNGQAESLERLGKRTQAEQLRTRMVAIFQSALDNRRMDFLTDIDYLCSNADFGSSTSDVAKFYEKLLAVREKTTSPHSDEFINTVVIYSRLMRTLGEKQIADDLEAHAAKLRKGGSAEVQIERAGQEQSGFDPDQSGIS